MQSWVKRKENCQDHNASKSNVHVHYPSEENDSVILVRLRNRNVQICMEVRGRDSHEGLEKYVIDHAQAIEEHPDVDTVVFCGFALF